MGRLNIYHSICNLYPLELSITHAIRDIDTNSNNIVAEGENKSKPEPVQDGNNRSVRPKRKATERFHRMLKENIDNL